MVQPNFNPQQIDATRRQFLQGMTALASNVIPFPAFQGQGESGYANQPLRMLQVGTSEEFGWDLHRLKDAYEAYLDSKRDEIAEQKVARRYYHGAQLTPSQVRAIEKRKIAPVIYNRIAPKIDEMVGVLEKIQQDPKAYPRGTNIVDQQQADIATEVVRFELDEGRWEDTCLTCATKGAVDGIAGIELTLDRHGDGYDPGFDWIDPADFCYDPRCFRLDFSDARYLGVGKWYDLEMAIDTWPDRAELLQASASSNSDFHKLSSNPEKDQKWFISDKNHNIERVRVVELWYRWRGGWRWAIFTGADILYSGEGYLYDDEGEQICKYIMFAANRDQDADAYGFVRNMKSPQDEINAWRMGLGYDLLSRRIIIKGEDPANLEKIRQEWARKDGTVIIPGGADAVIDDKSLDMKGAQDLITDAKLEIDRYGIDNTAMGADPKLSGAAIGLLQSAGLARLGPYFRQLKFWKLRVYRALWSQAKRYWQGERWIRVLDDQGQAQMIGINALQLQPHPVTGMPVPAMQNNLGELDVEIIMDEGPDVVNALQQTHDNLLQAQSRGEPVPAELLIETSPVDAKTKQKLMAMLTQQKQQASQPSPTEQLAAESQARLAQAQAMKLEADARKIMAEIGGGELATAKTLAEVEQTQADAAYKRAQAIEKVGTMPPDPGAVDIMSDLQGLQQLQQAQQVHQQRMLDQRRRQDMAMAQQQQRGQMAQELHRARLAQMQQPATA